MSPKYIRLRTRQALQILKDLESIVVSLDRIGSSHPKLTGRKFEHALSDFLLHGDVFKRLSRARTIISEVYSKAHGKTGEAILDKHLSHVHYWKLTK